MELTLTVIGGADDAPASEFKIKLPAVIGRGRSANVILKHSLVSRRHCELIADAGRVIVRDLNSLNGTFVGNQRVQEGTDAELPSGSLLTIGSVTFRAAYGEEDTSDFPPGYAEGSRGSKDTVSAIPSSTHRAGLKPAKLDALLQDASASAPQPAALPELEDELPAFIPLAEEAVEAIAEAEAVEAVPPEVFPPEVESPAPRKSISAATVRIAAEPAKPAAAKVASPELSTEEIPARQANGGNADSPVEIELAEESDRPDEASAALSSQDRQTEPPAAENPVTAKPVSAAHSEATLSSETLDQFLPASDPEIPPAQPVRAASHAEPDADVDSAEIEAIEEVADAELIDDDLVELELIEDEEPTPAALPLPPVVRPGIPPQIRRPG